MLFRISILFCTYVSLLWVVSHTWYIVVGGGCLFLFIYILWGWHCMRGTFLFYHSGILVLLFIILLVSVKWKHDSFIIKDGDATLFVASGVIVGYQGLETHVIEHSHDASRWLIKYTELQPLGTQVHIVGRKQSPDISSSFWNRSLISSGGMFSIGTFNYMMWLYMKGYHGVVYVDQLVQIGKVDVGGFSGVRSWVFDRIDSEYASQHIRALVRGLLVGDRILFSEKGYKEFIDAGLVHIIAVSGGNMIMLVLFLHILFFFVPYYVRLCVVSVGLICYGIICGLDSSVFRALIMGGLTLFSLAGGRVVSIWRLMGIAWIVMLCSNPYVLLYDVGFLLSFSALVGIVISTKGRSIYMGGKLGWGSRIMGWYIIPTIGAACGVLPVLLLFMGVTNITSVVQNVLVLPIIPLVMGWGFISLIGGYLYPLVFRSIPEIWFIEYIYYIAALAARYSIFVSIDNIIIRCGIVMALCLVYGGLYVYIYRAGRQDTIKRV